MTHFRPAPAPWLLRLESRFLRPYRRPIALSLLGMFVQSISLLPIPLLQGWVLDRLLASPGASSITTEAALHAILVGLLATVVCHVVRMVLAWKVATTMGRISQEVVVSLRAALYRKLMRLPMTYLDAQQTGRLMARVTSDVGSILAFLNAGSLQLLNDLILGLGIAALLLWVQWPLALVALFIVPLYAVNHRLFSRKILGLSAGIRAQLAAIYSLLSERVSAVRVVRSFVKEDAELAALDEHIDVHRDLSWSNIRTNAVLSALATMISGLGAVFVVSYGAVLVGRGQMSAGDLVAFYALIGQLYNPIVRLTQFQATTATMRTSVERIFEILDEPESVRDHLAARPLARARGALAFRKVRFAYSAASPVVLDGLDLTVEPGMTLGIFGASGSGKSTLLALIPRLYDLEPGGGSILLDGQDVRELRLSELRRAVALVSQEPRLFEGTIRTNLLYAAPDATANQIRKALETADLDKTVGALRLGLETPVGERGLALSGGQRQRLALARALVADPAVLLLDDCTSSLDAETEARVRAALADLSPRKTCLIVSHKVASLSRADWIIVLEGRTIAEQGTHSELMALGGRYAQAQHQQIRILDVRSPRSSSLRRASVQ